MIISKLYKIGNTQFTYVQNEINDINQPYSNSFYISIKESPFEDKKTHIYLMKNGCFALSNYFQEDIDFLEKLKVEIRLPYIHENIDRGRFSSHEEFYFKTEKEANDALSTNSFFVLDVFNQKDLDLLSEKDLDLLELKCLT